MTETNRSIDEIKRFKFYDTKDDDLIEIIMGNNNVYTCQKSNQAVMVLKNYIGDDISIFLDLHGVTDLFGTSDHLTDKKSVIISFVGKKGTTRDKARKDILERIKNKQVTFGILVFDRIKKKELMKPNTVGTKAWVISILSSNSKNSIFLDDSSDHIELVKCSNLPNVKTHLISSKDDVIKILKNF